MAYRINYSPIRKEGSRELRRGRLLALITLCFLVFLLLVQFQWSDGSAYIRVMLDRLASGLQTEESVLTTLLDYLTVFSL